MSQDRFGKSKTRAPASGFPGTPPTHTILAANTHFTGTLKAQGNVHLEDIFTGDISARGRVTVGKNATLDGSLICAEVVIAGLVRGNVAARTVSVLSTGRVLGDLRIEKLLTEEGAYLQGLITLEEDLDPSAVEAEAGSDRQDR